MLVLKHFKSFAAPSKDNEFLLLMDNHTSHCSYEVIKFAKANNIKILTFPPRLTNRIRPLDVGVYGPFKTTIKEAHAAVGTLSGKLEAIETWTLPRISCKPFRVSFTAKNIQSTFEATGLWPVNILKCSDVILSSPSDTVSPAVEDNDETDVVAPSASLQSLEKIRPLVEVNRVKKTKRSTGRCTWLTSASEMEEAEKRQKVKESKVAQLKPK